MTVDYENMIYLLSQIFWPMVRIGGLMLSVPVFSSNLISARIKMAFVFALGVICSSMVPPQMSFLHFNVMFLAYLFEELALGILMGFVLDLVFQVFLLGGQIIAMQAGLGFATMVDPSSKASVPLIAQFYLLMVTLVFLSLNGHLLILDTLIQSFKLMPIGQVNIDNGLIWPVLNFSGWMFKEGVLVAIPAILSLLIVSMSFGVMARVSPQLNIFSIGFPITLLMGIVIIYMTLPGVASQISDSLAEGMNLLKGMLR